jgi:hypothetical protein
MANPAQEAIYAKYFNSVVQLAQKTDPNGRVGVSRPELMHSLGISRTVADGLIGRCKLRRSRVEGKTEYFALSRSPKAVIGKASANSKETSTMTMTDAATPNPADPKGLVGAIVGDDEPAPTAQKGKKGKNRLPAEDQGGATPPAPPPAPEAPVTAPSAGGAPAATAIAGKKTIAQVDEEIKAIQAAMKAAGAKSEQAFQTYLAQKAHQEALGVKLQAALTERLTAV